MRLLNARIANFRRFADLTIHDVPKSAKLVILTGPNGSGKSSFFDAILLRYRIDSGFGWSGDVTYYTRSQEEFTDPEARITVTTDAGSPLIRGSVYVRTAYRNDHEFVTEGLRRQGGILDGLSLNRMIEPDATVSANYQRLAAQAMEDVFVKEDSATTMGSYREKLIGEVSEPLSRLFPDLTFVGVGNPLEKGTFKFNKGKTVGFEYKNLSGGEKACFDLILDMIIKKRSFGNSLYFIDEPEMHINTRIQGALLGELVGLLPGESQLWIASHSIGMMRKARDMYDVDPSSVAFIDFSGHDFDETIALRPTKPTRGFWESAMHVALDDLASLVAPRQVIICEGNPVGPVPGKNTEHDARIYDSIFGDEFPDAMFISAGNSKEIQVDFIGLATILPKLAPGMKIVRLIDRDDHAPADRAELLKKGIRSLSRRHLECYLYDDEILTALCVSGGRPEQSGVLLAAKEQALAGVVGRGFPSDDVKKVAGTVYAEAKRILGLTQVGNDHHAFERNVLSKLITPDTKIYAQMKSDVFDL